MTASRNLQALVSANFQQKCLTHNLFNFSVTLLWANCFCLHIKLRFLNERGNYSANLICFGVLTPCSRNAFGPEQTQGSSAGQVTLRCWFSKVRVVCIEFQLRRYVIMPVCTQAYTVLSCLPVSRTYIVLSLQRFQIKGSQVFVLNNIVFKKFAQCYWKYLTFEWRFCAFLRPMFWVNKHMITLKYNFWVDTTFLFVRILMKDNCCFIILKNQTFIPL